MASMLRLIAAALAASIATAGAPAAAQSFNFEDGSLRGWMQGGTAFRQQPTLGNNIAPRLPGATPGHDGNYWIGSYEARPTASVAIGTTQGDRPTGALISPLFTIRDNSLGLLVGGGADAARLHVDLLVETGPGDRGGATAGGVGSLVNVPEGAFRVHATATGQNNETMRRVEWDTRSVTGRRARIMITDDSPTGHINVDDIRPSNRVVAGEASRPPIATPVGGAGEMPAGSGVRGRFRVTAIKFAVEQQTYDTADEHDGRGDEVWVQADVFPLRRDGTTMGSVSFQTARIGERGELVGGSSRPGPFSASREVGGFITGDIYPPPGARPRRRDLPLRLWEGTLEQGGNGVLIIPSIWEYDNNDRFEETRWANGLPEEIARHRDQLARAVTTPRPSSESPIFSAMRLAVGNNGNRPIGAHPSDGTRRTPVKALVLNYDRAQQMANSGGGSLMHDMVDPDSTALLFAGRGEVVIRYLDAEGLNGTYALLVRVERLAE
jgi:hypothetical protein